MQTFKDEDGKIFVKLQDMIVSLDRSQYRVLLSDGVDRFTTTYVADVLTEDVEYTCIDEYIERIVITKDNQKDMFEKIKTTIKRSRKSEIVPVFDVNIPDANIFSSVEGMTMDNASGLLLNLHFQYIPREPIDAEEVVGYYVVTGIYISNSKPDECLVSIDLNDRGTQYIFRVEKAPAKVVPFNRNK